MFVGIWAYPEDAVLCAAPGGATFLDVYTFTPVNDYYKASCAVVSSPFPNAFFQQGTGWSANCLKVERKGNEAAVNVTVKVKLPAWVRTQTADYPAGGVCPLACP